MKKRIAEEKRKACQDCPVYKECQDTLTSWFFLFIGLLATVAIRVVNFFLDLNPLWAKIFWYIGVGGFFIYFLYKFRQDRNIQKELSKRMMADKLSGSGEISSEERQFLKAILCKLKSNKDTINYFVIFVTSGLALLLGIYLDLVK